MRQNAINEAVRKFRAVMDEHYELFDDFFQCLPRGCWGDTSELLAAYLKDQELGDFAYVSGWSAAKDSSLAWLEIGNRWFDPT